MSGYLMIIGLVVCLQSLRVISANEYAEKKMQNNIWLTDVEDDKQLQPPASRFERNDQYEVPSDVVIKNGSPYPKITRRGFAGEEFFLKASKSVPRIGRRNNDVAVSPKRSAVNSKDQTNAAEYWSFSRPNDIGQLTNKNSFDLEFGCKQLDAKTILLMDTSNFECDDKFYCCMTTTRVIIDHSNANNM